MTDASDPGPDGRLPLPPELSPRRSHRDARPARLRWVRVASWLAVGTSALVLGLSGAGFVYYEHLDGNIHRIPLKIPGKQPAEAQDGAENILLVGDDDRAGLTPAELQAIGTTDDGGSDNTDTIIILHLAPDNGPATLVSIPRDSYVPIPGHGSFKINSAYADGERDQKGGGPGLLTATVENLTGIHIDHFISVSFGQFVNISNAIGGVRVCVVNPDLVGYQPDDGVRVPAEYEHGAYEPRYDGLKLTEGLHTLEGADALKFVRQRHDLPGGDLDRIHRQQRFITAVEDKATSETNPATLNRILESATKSLTVDSGLTGLKLLDLADRLKNLKPADIRFTTIPVANGNATVRLSSGQIADIVALDMARLPTFFTNLKGERDPNAPAPATPNPLSTVTPATPAQTTVAVENGSGVSRAAAHAQASLESYGFQVPSVGTVAVTGATTIRYNPADAAAAAELARSVTGATVAADPTLPAGTVELVLGTGFGGVHAPTAASPSTSSPSPSSTANDGTTSAADLNQGATMDGVPCGP